MTSAKMAAYLPLLEDASETDAKAAQAMKKMRRNNNIIIGLVMLLAVAMPALIWFTLGQSYVPSESLEAIVKSHTAELQANQKALDVEQADEAKAVAALKKNVDDELAKRQNAMAELKRRMASEQSARTKSVAGLNRDVQAVKKRVERERSDMEKEFAAVNDRVKAQHSEWMSAVGGVEESVSSESKARIEAIAALTKLEETGKSESEAKAAIIPNLVERLDVEKKVLAVNITEVNKRVASEEKVRQNVNQDILMRVMPIVSQLSDGICTYCVSCGGEWPKFMGETTMKMRKGERREASCAGSVKTVEKKEEFEGKISLCCVGS
mmetsp:Transcript_124086/g.201727  ORF Transcript_124086/g.201727 Transcript_124086/m.201727 type:complete len:324 (+) Transcript_124086:59-1030(+)